MWCKIWVVICKYCVQKLCEKALVDKIQMWTNGENLPLQVLRNNQTTCGSSTSLLCLWIKKNERTVLCQIDYITSKMKSRQSTFYVGPMGELPFVCSSSSSSSGMSSTSNTGSFILSANQVSWLAQRYTSSFLQFSQVYPLKLRTCPPFLWSDNRKETGAAVSLICNQLKSSAFTMIAFCGSCTLRLMRWLYAKIT